MLLVNLTAKKVIIFAKIPIECLPSGIIAKVQTSSKLVRLMIIGDVKIAEASVTLLVIKHEQVVGLPIKRQERC